MESGGMGNLIFIATIFAVFYFFLIRPQAKRQKQQAQFVDALQRGMKLSHQVELLGKYPSLMKALSKYRLMRKHSSHLPEVQ